MAVAERLGLGGVFEMPNTDPPLVTRDAIHQRIQLADDAASPIFHGLYAGLTSDPRQIEEMLKTHEDLFPRVVGLKLYAGSTTGNLAVTTEAAQKSLFQVLAKADYRGVLAVHCEKESLIERHGGKERLFRRGRNPRHPLLHCSSRPPEAEIESVRDILRLASEVGFQGTFHVCHVSTPDAVRHIAEARNSGALRITCGVTPHHLLLSEDDMRAPRGYLLRMNPPLRKERLRSALFDLLLSGSIDWIESDHAPHLVREKRKGASGIPVLPIYPYLLRFLRHRGLTGEQIQRLVHDNILAAFEMPVGLWRARQGSADGDLSGEYDFDPFSRWKEINPC